MNLFDRIFVGEVIHDFGVIKEKNMLIGTMWQSVLLTKKGGKFQVVIRSSTGSFMGGGINYLPFDIDEALKLRDCITESEAFIKNSSDFKQITPQGFDQQIPFYKHVVAIAAFFFYLLLLLLPIPLPFVLIGTIWIFFMQINNYQEFQRFGQVEAWEKILPAVLASLVLIVGISKLLWLVLLS